MVRSLHLLLVLIQRRNNKIKKVFKVYNSIKIFWVKSKIYFIFQMRSGKDVIIFRKKNIIIVLKKFIKLKIFQMVKIVNIVKFRNRINFNKIIKIIIKLYWMIFTLIYLKNNHYRRQKLLLTLKIFRENKKSKINLKFRKFKKDPQK